MKLIYMVVLFSSMLFGMQKQIILGSYALESNGLNAVQNAQKQIENDEKLKTIMEKNSAKVMATRVSNFTVVSVNVFDTYTELLPAMQVFRTYYKDAFSLNYPTKGFLEKENFKVVTQKANEEKEIRKLKEVEATSTQKQEIGIVEKILLAQAAMLEKEELVKSRDKLAEVKEDARGERLQSTQSIQGDEDSYTDSEPMQRTYTVVEGEDGMSQLDYNLLVGLILLVLMIGGFIIYNKVNKDETNK